MCWAWKQPSRFNVKLCMTVYKCLHGLVQQDVSELCVSVADVAGRRQLTPLCKPTTSILSSLQQDKLRLTCVFVRRSSRLELNSWKCAEVHIYSHLQARRIIWLEFWGDAWRRQKTFSYIVMQVIWCLKFCNMTKSGGTIPPAPNSGRTCPRWSTPMLQALSKGIFIGADRDDFS